MGFKNNGTRRRNNMGAAQIAGTSSAYAARVFHEEPRNSSSRITTAPERTYGPKGNWKTSTPPPPAGTHSGTSSRYTSWMPDCRRTSR